MSFQNGFLILDKPLGITSAKAVAEVKRILKCKKIGHAGTLDPLASGILPLAIGEATKAVDYVMHSMKQYRFTIIFGESRDTQDSEGAVTARTETLPTRAAIEANIPAFIGTIMQVPPSYSALKVDGKRAYALARAGETVELTARPVDIHSLVLMGAEAGEGDALRSATLEMSCGKGTYVRSLARDIAIKCNSLGYVSALRRTAVGKFSESKAILLDKLPDSVHNAALFEAWVPIELALDDIPAINMNPEQSDRLRHGQVIPCETVDGKYMALQHGQIVAMVEAKGGLLKSLRVFNL